MAMVFLIFESQRGTREKVARFRLRPLRKFRIEARQATQPPRKSDSLNLVFTHLPYFSPDVSTRDGFRRGFGEA